MQVQPQCERDHRYSDRVHHERRAASIRHASRAAAVKAKYARTETARITATPTVDALVLTIEDDGVGGATPSPGSELSGLKTAWPPSLAR